MNTKKLKQLSPALIIGDFSVLLLFALLGRSFHSMKLDLSALLLTTLPFFLAWLLVGLLFGVFHRSNLFPSWGIIKKLALNTLIAVPLAIFLRQLLLTRPTDLSFLYASWAAVFLFVLLWRLPFTWYWSKFLRG